MWNLNYLARIAHYIAFHHYKWNNVLLKNMVGSARSVMVRSQKGKCHSDEIFFTGWPGSCQNNFQCSQWWQLHPNGIISVSVIFHAAKQNTDSTLKNRRTLSCIHGRTHGGIWWGFWSKLTLLQRDYMLNPGFNRSILQAWYMSGMFGDMRGTSFIYIF